MGQLRVVNMADGAIVLQSEMNVDTIDDGHQWRIKNLLLGRLEWKRPSSRAFVV